MLTYLVRRILIGCVTLFVITLIVYWLIRNMPGTPLTMDMAVQQVDKSISKADLERLNQYYGLDKPWYEAYFLWVNNLSYFDFGRSFSEKKPVTKVIGERIGPTLLLAAPSLFLSYLISVPIGLWSTANRGNLRERSMSTLLYMLYSMPTFVTAMLLLIVFYQYSEGKWWQLTPGMQSSDYDQLSSLGKMLDRLKHMILPVFCYTYGSIAYYSRFIKANMEEVIRQDYIRTARAKGVGPRRTLVVHAFRNTMIPFVTMIGLTLPALVGGSIVLEQIFNWPGMGQLFLEKIAMRDYPVIMGLTLIFSVATLAGQLLADILYAIADPRVTYS